MNEYRTPPDSMTVLTERAVVVIEFPEKMPVELRSHHAEDIRKAGGPGTIVIIGPVVILDEDVKVVKSDDVHAHRSDAWAYCGAPMTEAEVTNEDERAVTCEECLKVLGMNQGGKK